MSAVTCSRAACTPTVSVEHNGFPVLYADEEDGQPRRGGNVAGLIYRKHLCVLLSAVSRDLPVARSEPSRRESVRLNREASVGAPLVLPRRQTVDEPSNSHVLSWQTMEGNFPRYPKAEDVVLVGVQRYVVSCWPVVCVVCLSSSVRSYERHTCAMVRVLA